MSTEIGDTCENCTHERDEIIHNDNLDMDLCLSCASFHFEFGRLPSGNGSITEVDN